MAADNPLTTEFLQTFPLEAARVLEQLAAKDVAALFDELPPTITAPVLVAMMPINAAGCVTVMTLPAASATLAEIPLPQAVRIYRLLSSSKQHELFGHLPEKYRRGMRRLLNYVAVSAGDLMDANAFMLPADLTVAEALRRIEKLAQPICCEIYIVDNHHRLSGTIELGKLLTSNHHATLQKIMARKVQSLSVHAMANTLLNHPGWRQHNRLPVVERDNTLVGVLEQAQLQALDRDEITHNDSLDGAMSLSTLYWLMLTHLLETLFALVSANKRAKR